MSGLTEKEYWYWIWNIPGIGNARIRQLLQLYDSPKDIYHFTKEKELAKIEGFGPKTIQALLDSRIDGKIQKSYDKLMKAGIYFVTKEDDEYPNKLKNIYDPPYCFYLKGKLPKENKPTIAIVGARECTEYGREMAGYFAKNLGEQGVQIVSGLARGVDSYAHKGALHTVGNTFAVLGSGIDICYPRENFNLYYEMIETGGGIISEYGLGASPIPGNFPMRNRLISGMADGILLIEAKEKSGSFITIDYGLDQGKNIYALPGRVSDDFSRGCNNVIKMGAKLVQSPQDVLEDYGIIMVDDSGIYKKNNNSLESNEKIVYASLSFIAKHMEEIILETNLKPEKLSEILLNLQLKGYIKQTHGNYYIINPN